MNKILITSLFRSKGSVITLLLLIVFGLISLGIGKHFLERKQQSIAQVLEKKEANTLGNIKNNRDDLGLLLYYQKFGFINETPNIAGLSIGLRVANSTIKDVTIRNLEEQKYASELINPFYQLFGNMDFSFVLIYFFPLVIIILCFNILSEEKETKRWNIILIQSQKPLSIIWNKIWIRYFFVISIALSLLIVAKFYLSIPLDGAFLQFIFTSVLYISFWFALCLLLISFNQSSSSNLLYVLMIWILFSVIAPAVVNALSQSLFPLPESYNTAIKSREGYHEKWDMDKTKTIEMFQAEYPQFSQYSHPEAKPFSWLWYYAMQHMGDLEAKEEAQQLYNKLHQRLRFIQTASWFLPSIHTQLALNRLTRADQGNYILFLKALKQFHKRKRLEFYPNIFNGEKAKKEDLTNENIVAYYNEKQGTNIWFMILPFMIGISLMMIWARKNLQQNLKNKHTHDD